MRHRWPRDRGVSIPLLPPPAPAAEYRAAAPNLPGWTGMGLMSPSHQEGSRTDRDRRDNAGGPGTTRAGSRPAPTHPSRTIAPIPAPEPPFLVRKAQSNHCDRGGSQGPGHNRQEPEDPQYRRGAPHHLHRLPRPAPSPGLEVLTPPPLAGARITFRAPNTGARRRRRRRRDAVALGACLRAPCRASSPQSLFPPPDQTGRANRASPSSSAAAAASTPSPAPPPPESCPP